MQELRVILSSRLLKNPVLDSLFSKVFPTLYSTQPGSTFVEEVCPSANSPMAGTKQVVIIGTQQVVTIGTKQVVTIGTRQVVTIDSKHVVAIGSNNVGTIGTKP